jgi:hypothetical protein
MWSAITCSIAKLLVTGAHYEVLRWEVEIKGKLNTRWGVSVHHQAPAALSVENLLPLSFGLVCGYKSKSVWTMHRRKKSKAWASNILVAKGHTFIVGCSADCSREKSDIISD